MPYGLNSLTIKVHNELVILDLIRRYPMSRRELAELSGLTPATVSAIITRLMTEGVVAEGDKVPSRGGSKGGRRRTYLELVAASRMAGGMLMDRSGIEGSVVDIRGTLYAQHSHRLPCTLDKLTAADMVALVVDMIDQLQHRLPLGSSLAGWGMGVPWWYPSAIDWAAITEKVRQRTQVSTLRLVQNAVSAAMGEWWYADHPLAFPSLELFLGGGIGGCVIQQGENDFAPNFQPIEIGHMGIHPDGPPCYCGGFGCLEQFSGPASPLAQEDLDKAARYLAYALRSLMLLFDLREIIVSGPQSDFLATHYLPTIREALGPQAPPIRMSQVHLQNQAVGAAAVVFDSEGRIFGPALAMQ